MQTSEQRRYYAYERFEQNRRFEEKTDIAERLGYPIDVTIDYTLKDGALYALSDTVERPFHSQTLQAKLAGNHKFSGDQAFERTRLGHEHDEALMVDKLALGELNGNVLIKFSKVPDAVVENRTSIKGYRRDLLRSFVRLYHRTDEGVKCRLFTLDHNHAAGLRRVGKLLDIDLSRQSEDVLADYRLEDVHDPETFTEMLTNRIKAEYDTAIFQETGLQRYAGSLYIDQRDAMRIIDQQPLLIDQHLTAVSSIVGEANLEQARERTAAAIKLASEGQRVVSLNDASVNAEVQSGNYGGECATGSTIGMNQAGQARAMENIWKHGECQVCFVRTMVGSCYVCATCAAADDNGVDLLRLREKNLRRRAQESKLGLSGIEKVIPKQNHDHVVKSKTNAIKRQYGEHAVTQRIITVGGAREVIRDRRTNEVLVN